MNFRAYQPYLTALKVVVVLGVYASLVLVMGDPAEVGNGQRWLMWGLGVYLTVAVLVRNWPQVRLPAWAGLAWLLCDTALWLGGQAAHWYAPAMNAGLVLAVDAVTVGWAWYRGLVHWGAVAGLVVVLPAAVGLVPRQALVQSFLLPLVPALLLSYGFVYRVVRAAEESEAATRARAEAELANRHLREQARQVEELAVVRERNRIAREVHNNVAHTFTGIIMHMDLMERLMERDPAQARGALERVREQASDALEEVRRSVHALRPLQMEELRGLPALHKLVNDFAATTGMQAGLAAEGAPVELPIVQELCLYRCLQESLTNALRHGRATRVTVTVADDGRGASGLKGAGGGGAGTKGARTTGNGLGLLGIRERAAALGGSMEAGPGPGGGWLVRLTLPTLQPDGGTASA